MWIDEPRNVLWVSIPVHTQTVGLSPALFETSDQTLARRADRNLGRVGARWTSKVVYGTLDEHCLS